MNQEMEMRRARLTTPRAAAVAGILFSVLLITSLVLLRISVPADPRDAGEWLSGNSSSISLALNLIPFAGVAFLWFMGVVRDRLGEYEDQLFATVFLGSGLLFLAMLFASSGMAGGLIAAYAGNPAGVLASGSYAYGRAVTYEIMNVYAIKMAGVFMIATCTLFVRTKIVPRWMALIGYALALVLLLSIGYVSWIALVFPLWVLLISIYILVENYRGKYQAATLGEMGDKA